MIKFQWENKQAGTFFLHGDRWMVERDRLTSKPIIKPNYNLHLGQKIHFTKSMRKTIDENKQEIISAINN